ncbi:hypothetical protein EW026_g4845 [Hermanssonia centrifuga]|uniref:Uncharacterized protein n=1 Tax=Hermanssonia centrifuga TaxID=98765 RepID=A0A4S4KG68_9APHY|nr:hypothetical protein EW026_g4845 [Hermanssonia centrifuga]
MPSIFAIYLMNLILWTINIITLDELGTGYSFTVSAVLANRLLISVREKYYTFHGELTQRKTYTTMHFQTGPGAAPAEGDSEGGTTIAAADAATAGLPTLTEGTSTTANSEWGDPMLSVMDEYEMENFSERRGF